MNSTLTNEQSAEVGIATAPETSADFPELSVPAELSVPDMGIPNFVPEISPEEAAAFVPDTAEKVEWVLSRIADHEGRAARVLENAQTMARQQIAQANYLRWLFGGQLQSYARANTEGKRRSIQFLNGKIGFRTKPANFEIDSLTALVWASENAPETLRVDKDALKKTFMVNDAGQVLAADTGEVLEFATAIPAEEVFYIK